MTTDAYEARKAPSLEQIAGILQMILNELRAMNRPK